MQEELKPIKPDAHGDWISHRDGGFEEMIPLAAETKFESKTHSVFVMHSRGIATARDAWNYNFSLKSLKANIDNSILFFNEQSQLFQEAKKADLSIEIERFLTYDSTKFSWNRSSKNDASKGKTYKMDPTVISLSQYRAFNKQNLYYSSNLNDMMYQLPKIFPTPRHENLLICMPGLGVTKDYSAIITNCVPDVQLMANGQCFPLYYYEKNKHGQTMNLFDQKEEYIRRDGVSDFILNRVRELCGQKATKPDIFYYVYGVLHSEEYRTKFAVNLKKELPRLPLPEEPKVFWEFSRAGRSLAELHLNYETLEPHPAVKETAKSENPSLRVDKMRFGKRGNGEDKTSIVYNDQIMLWDIPLEAYEYVVNGKPALEWIMERYQVTKHKESGIVNDPNLWCDEQGQPRYIVDLIKRIVTVSIETIKIVKSLPRLNL